MVTILAVAVALTGCASSTSSTAPGSAPSVPASGSTASGATLPTSAPAPASQLRRAPRRAGAPARSLAVSNASVSQVQPQAPAGSCHASGSGLYSLPDPHCTPGALNPAVTQATIDQTICVSGYTKTIRPAERVTEAEKRGSMAAYGDTGSMSGFEYDHLISLELGGAANDTRNLWPEPGASPNPKDAVEDELHVRVCSGQMPLTQAQHIVAGDWVSYAHSHSSANTAAPRSSPLAAPPQARSVPSSSSSALTGRVHCRDFATHLAAQQWFVNHGGSASRDVSGLDANHNGLACEDLP
jgi:hypothetical protein